MKLRREILPSLEAAGLIVQGRDPEDGRKMLVYPTDSSPISSDETSTDPPPISYEDPVRDEEYRGSICGVNKHDNDGPLFGDLIPELIKGFPREEYHLEDFWINWFKMQGCSQGRAEAYFEGLKGQLLFYGEGGWALG